MRKASLISVFLVVFLASSFIVPFANATSVLSDGFENADWDVNFDGNGVTAWTQGQAGEGEAGHSPHAGSNDAWASNGAEGVITSDDLNLAGATSAYLSFYYYLDDNEETDLILYYYDGAAYDAIVNLGGGTESTWLFYEDVEVDSAYLISNFRIRLDATLGTGENCFIDDVVLTKDVDLVVNLAETPVVTDTLAKQNSLYRTMTEILAVEDVSVMTKATMINMIADLSASSDITDGLYETKTIVRSLVETSVITDEFGNIKAIYRTLEDGAQALDTLGTKRGIFAVLAEAAGASDNLGALKGIGVYLLETLDELDGLFVQKSTGVAYYETVSDVADTTADLSTTKSIFKVLSDLVDTTGSSDVTKHIVNTFLDFLDTANVEAVLRAVSPLFPVGPTGEELTAETAVALGIVFAIVFSLCFGLLFARRRTGEGWEERDEGDSGVWQVF